MFRRLILTAAVIGCYSCIHAQGSFTSPDGYNVTIAPANGFPFYSVVTKHISGNGAFSIATGDTIGAPAGIAALYVAINQLASNSVNYSGICSASVVPGFMWTLSVTPPVGATAFPTIYVPVTFDWGQYMAADVTMSRNSVPNFWADTSTSDFYGHTYSLTGFNTNFLLPLAPYSLHVPAAGAYYQSQLSASPKWRLTDISKRTETIIVTCRLQQNGTYMGNSAEFYLPNLSTLLGFAEFSQPASAGLAQGTSLSAAGPMIIRTERTSHYSGPAPVNLGLAGTYTVFADTGISNATTPAAITGNMGVGPGVTSTAITGFALTLPAGGAYSTSAQVNGKVYAFDYASPTPTNVTTASQNMAAAYKDAAGRINPDYLNLKTGNLAGLTLYPGLYKWGTAVTLPVGSDVTLSGGANDVWIFQISGSLTAGAATHVFLAGGAKAKNIFWQVAGTSVTLGANADFSGVVLAKDAINFGSKARATSRLLASTAVNLDQNAVTQPPQ